MTLPEQPNDGESLERLFETFARTILTQMSAWAASGGIFKSTHQFVDFTEDSYILRYEVKQDYWDLLQRYHNQAFWNQEAEVFEQFARKPQQTVLKGNVPVPVSSEGVRKALYPGLLSPVVDILERYATFQPTQEQVLECYSRYYAAWTATSIQWEVTLPLTTFLCDLQQPVQINAHFQLAPFNLEEKTFVWNQCAKLEYINPISLHAFHHTGFRLMGSQIAKRDDIGSEELHMKTENTITAFRLIKAGDIGVLACFGISSLPPISTPSYFVMPPDIWPFPEPDNLYFLQHGSFYAFTEADLPVVEMISEALEKLGKQKSGLAVALRRFNQSYSRRTHEGRIIDLTIALESCLLPGVSEGELSYKFALYGAALLAQAKIWAPEKAQALLSALYAIRSAIVHSGQQLSNLGDKQKKLLEKLAIPPDDFPDQCEDIVRDILRTYVIWLAQGGTVRAISDNFKRYIVQSLSWSSSEDEGSDG